MPAVMANAPHLMETPQDPLRVLPARLAEQVLSLVHVQEELVDAEETAKKASCQIGERETVIVDYARAMNSIGSVPLTGNSLCTAFCEDTSCQSSSTTLSPFNNINTTSCPKKRQKKTKSNTNFSYENSIEYNTLIQRYSSGVRLPELCSIAKILCSILSGISEPSREEKRSFPLLIQWYHNYWEFISPVLPFIQLRDESNQVIDGRRELIEKCLQCK